MHAIRHASTMASSKIPHVAVVGAGIAGLRCADVLARSGVVVTLFEARDRVGGRVHQVDSAGHLVDMGPNWIHGTKGNPIMRLAEQTRTVVMEPEERQALFDAEGARRADSEAVDLSTKMWELVVDAFKYSDDNSARIDPHESLFEYFRAKIDREEAGLDRRQRDDLLREAQMWGPFVGDAVETQSLKFFFLEECIEGENVFVASTYRDILEEVSRTATSNSDNVDLRLETEIVHFELDDSNSDGASNGNENINSNGEDGQHHSNTSTVTVTTSSGQKHTFDEVVVTCPLGWLKQHHESAFTPRLPRRLTSAISNINYGRLEKLYVTFPRAFWLSNDGDPSSYPIFTHFHDPAYVPHPADEAWNQSVVSLAHLPAPTAHPTLLFYMYGACGARLVSSTADLPPHSAEYNSTLDDFARPFYSRLPNYTPSNPSCTPASFVMTQWQADRLAGNGSYCNFQVGLERGDEDIECMRDAGGLTGRGLWLAGEHTAPFIALGTTTGAWWSGEAVARRLCGKYGVEVPAEKWEQEQQDGLNTLGVNGVNGEEAGKKDLDKKKIDGANLSGLAI
jgi:monoamine oxidase